MDLKNKIMKLYEDILEPVKARKIVLLLKYVIVDGETDINKIRTEIPIGENTIRKYVADDNEMLKYLTHDELKEFRTKMDKVLEANNKLLKLIKKVLVENETDLNKIINSIPISIETLRKYLNDKENLSKYLTKEELDIFLNRMDKIINKINTKLETLIKLVLIEGETNLDVIERKTPIKISTIQKHIEDTKELEKHLKPEELTIFVNRVKKMLSDKVSSVEQEKVMLIKKTIDDIFNTRYLYRDICAKNFLTMEEFERYLHDEEFMKREYRDGTLEKIKERIKENDSVRKRKPRDHYIIEDRFSIMITKPEINYLKQFDYKKLNYVTEYLCTGANLELVMKKLNTSMLETMAILSSPKIKEILNDEYYEVLKHCLMIENKLLGSDLNQKKQLIIEVTTFLEQNNFDMKMAMVYFRIPEPIFKKILFELIKLPYSSIETKQVIKEILDIESEKKVR